VNKQESSNLEKLFYRELERIYNEALKDLKRKHDLYLCGVYSINALKGVEAVEAVEAAKAAKAPKAAKAAEAAEAVEAVEAAKALQISNDAEMAARLGKEEAKRKYDLKLNEQKVELIEQKVKTKYDKMVKSLSLKRNLELPRKPDDLRKKIIDSFNENIEKFSLELLEWREKKVTNLVLDSGGAEGGGGVEPPNDSGGVGGVEPPNDSGGVGGVERPNDSGGVGGVEPPNDSGGVGGVERPNDSGGVGGMGPGVWKGGGGAAADPHARLKRELQNIPLDFKRKIEQDFPDQNAKNQEEKYYLAFYILNYL
jgi:NACalpha-BTF3-like transcription factor